MRRVVVIVFAVLAGSALARAGDDVGSRKERVAAATSSAVDGLQQEIGRQAIGKSLTVKKLLDDTGEADVLRSTLQTAQQIGGPRWIDEQTCQVQLEISGARVSRALIQIAATNPQSTPINADDLAVRLRGWNGRMFSAIGSSTGASSIENIRPPETVNAWADVTEEARRKAVETARYNAMHRVLNSLRGLEIKPNVTLGSILDNPESMLREDVMGFRMTLPVTSVQFRDDRQVEVTLAARPQDVIEMTRWSLSQAADAPLAWDDPAWGKLQEAWMERIAPAIGRASADARAEKKVSKLPARAPAWVKDQMEAEGVAGPSADTRQVLRTARAAESAALRKLQAQINGLPLSEGVTVGQAARQDDRLAEAVSRAVTRARPHKSDYRADGSVAVKVSLDLQALWEELRQAE